MAFGSVLWKINHVCPESTDFPVAQMVKNLPAMLEIQVQSLGWEDPLEKGMAIHSSKLAWRIPWTEKPGSYSPWGRKELDMTERLTHTLNPLP